MKHGTSFRALYNRVRKVAVRSAYQLRHGCSHAWTRLPLDGFPWNLILVTFIKICPENSSLVKIAQKYRALYMKTYGHFILLAATHVAWQQYKLGHIVKLPQRHLRYCILLTTAYVTQEMQQNHRCVSTSRMVTRTSNYYVKPNLLSWIILIVCFSTSTTRFKSAAIYTHAYMWRYRLYRLYTYFSL